MLKRGYFFNIFLYLLLCLGFENKLMGSRLKHIKIKKAVIADLESRGLRFNVQNMNKIKIFFLVKILYCFGKFNSIFYIFDIV